jgi:transmembrane sensor
MNQSNHIPPGDPDAILAKEYGEMLSTRKLSGRKPFARKLFDRKPGLDHPDPLFRILEKSRMEAERAESEIEVRGQEQGWKQIESIIERSAEGSIVSSGKSRRMRLVPAIPAKQWQWLAAAVVILAMATLFLLLRTSDPGLQILAESGDTRSTITLADGSTVTLRPHSTLHLIALTESEHAYALTGEALFDVAPALDRTFAVQAGPGRVVVAGTRFNLNYRENQARVYLLDGVIRFETIDRGQEVMLAPGTAAVIDVRDGLSEPFGFEPGEVTAWMRDRLFFRDRPASSILAELEHHFDITVEVPTEISRERLGGSIALETAGQSLGDLGVVLGGEFVRTGERAYAFKTER